MSDKAAAFVESIKKRLDSTALGWQQNVDEYLAVRDRCSTFVPKVRRTCFAVSQIPVELYSPADDADGCIMFLHGGFYFLPIIDFYRAVAEQLALLTRKNVVLVDYAVYPYVYPSALQQVQTVWDWLCDNNNGVALFGDGSGAQLALSLALLRRQQHTPTALALVSPQVDMTASGDSYYDNFYLDVQLGCKRLGGMDIPDAVRSSPLVYHFAAVDLSSPHVSPLFASLMGLPPCYIAVGEHEILLSDATRLYARLQQAGVRSHLAVGPAMFHAYPLYYDKCPEAKEELRAIARFLAKYPNA